MSEFWDYADIILLFAAYCRRMRVNIGDYKKTAPYIVTT